MDKSLDYEGKPLPQRENETNTVAIFPMNSSNHEPVRLIVPVTDLTLREVLMRGSTFQTEARRSGGVCRVFRLPRSVQIDLEGVSQSSIDYMVSRLAETVMKNKDDLEIARFVRTKELPPNVISGEFFREKLTKKFLLGLPQGAWLVSNGIPPWIAHLSDRSDRQRFWKQLTESREARRLVSVVWSEQDAKIFAETAASLFPPTTSRIEALKRSFRLQITGGW